jgi:hypothetical protein
MKIMVEILRKFRLIRKPENIPVPTDVDKIKHISLSAAQIWFDDSIRKEDKRELYNTKALEASQLITPELTKDPDFHQQLSPKVHIRAIQLLGTFVPDEKGYESFKNDPNSVHRIIVGYVNGFVEYNKSFLLGETDANDDKSNEKLIRSLRSLSYLPRYYIEEICEEIGLCPKPNPSEKSNNMLNTNLLTRFKTQDKSG